MINFEILSQWIFDSSIQQQMIKNYKHIDSHQDLEDHSGCHVSHPGPWNPGGFPHPYGRDICAELCRFRGSVGWGWRLQIVVQLTGTPSPLAIYVSCVSECLAWDECTKVIFFWDEWISLGRNHLFFLRQWLKLKFPASPYRRKNPGLCSERLSGRGLLSTLRSKVKDDEELLKLLGFGHMTWGLL